MQSMDKLNSLDVSYYDDDAVNLCIYANLIEFAKAHGYSDLTIEQILAIHELDIEQQIRDENFVLLLVIGLPGITLSIVVIVVIGLKKEVTSFDMLCFFIAIVDLVFILNAVVLEGVVGHNIAGYSNKNEYVSIYYDTTTPILGHPLSYTIFYIHVISSIPSSILCTFRSLNRMVAIYFPINYSTLFTNKRMIILSLGVIMLTIVGCLPIWIFSGPYEKTQNFYFYSFLNIDLASVEEVPVVLPYFFISSYSEYITIMISIIIDTCTAIKLAMYFKSHADGWTASKLIRELYFLFQNFITVLMFLVSLIPYIFFMAVCQGADRRCYITPLQQLIVLLYECYSRRVMWRTIDQLVALIVQIRIYWDDIRAIFVKTPSTTTPVEFLS